DSPGRACHLLHGDNPALNWDNPDISPLPTYGQGHDRGDQKLPAVTRTRGERAAHGRQALLEPGQPAAAAVADTGSRPVVAYAHLCFLVGEPEQDLAEGRRAVLRSEERRVGTEGGCRGGAEGAT